MAKPPSSTRTVRLYDRDWEWLKEEALRRDVSVNSLVALSVETLRKPVSREPAVVKAKAAVELVHKAHLANRVTGAEDAAFLAEPTWPEKLRMPRAPIGSRLKKPPQPKKGK